jgi:branched-chain amino acid transport system ATP-binding protein
MLQLQGITAGYGDVPVLRNISLNVPDGTAVALIGPNGAGKTTLLRVASGLLVPDQGRVLLDGEDLTGLSSHALAARGICHVPEGRGVFPNLTVRENIRLFAAPGSEAESETRAFEAFPKLGRRSSQVVGTMSGGEQQMVALARAYVSHPRFVLLDEVSMGLAPKIVDEIFEFLERLTKEGSSLLLVEQFVTKALEVADVVFLLARGTVDFAGEPSELEGEDVFARYAGANFASDEVRQGS